MVIKICEASKQCYWSSLKAKSTPVWKKYATAGNDGSDYYELCICFFILLVNPTRKIVCSVADTFHVEIFDNSLHIRGGQVTCVVSLISLHPTTGKFSDMLFIGPRSVHSLGMSVTHKGTFWNLMLQPCWKLKQFTLADWDTICNICRICKCKECN